MIKSSLAALTIFAAVSAPAMASVVQVQNTSVGVVGASINSISSVGLGLGLAVNSNTISQTQNANPTNVNLNSLHQLDQNQMMQGTGIQLQ